jgi:hypothetical protein
LASEIDLALPLLDIDDTLDFRPCAQALIEIGGRAAIDAVG